MAKVLFFSYPYSGHINPTIGLIKELTNRGENVLYYATPCFKEMIESQGARFQSYGSYINDLIDKIEPKKSVGSLGAEIGGMVGFVNILLEIGSNYTNKFFSEYNEAYPDYIIHDSYSVWGSMIARKIGVPAIVSNPSFAFSDKLLDADMDYVINVLMELMEDSFLKDKSSFKRLIYILSKNIGEKYDINDFNIFNICNSKFLNIVHTSRLFQPYGEIFDECFKFVGRPIDNREEKADFPFERLGDRPIIYISFGTTSFNKCPGFYQKCIKAFENYDKTVVLSVGNNVDISSLGYIPENFIIRNFVPQIKILKRSSLFITHGGLGGVSEAAVFGVPLIVFPQGGDQNVVGMRVKQTGAGLCINNTEINPGELKAAADFVYSNENFRFVSKTIGQSLKTSGGYVKAVDEIFACIEKYKRSDD